MLRLRKIICPTDFSELSCEAVKAAGALAMQSGAELCLLHVTQPIQPSSGLSPFPEHVPVNVAQQEKGMAEGAERELRGILDCHQFENLQTRPNKVLTFT